MLTHLLTGPDCEAFRDALLDQAANTTGPACSAWMDAVILLDKHRSASFQRRAKLVSHKPRKTLGLRYSR